MQNLDLNKVLTFNDVKYLFSENKDFSVKESPTFPETIIITLEVINSKLEKSVYKPTVSDLISEITSLGYRKNLECS